MSDNILRRECGARLTLFQSRLSPRGKPWNELRAGLIQPGRSTRDLNVDKSYLLNYEQTEIVKCYSTFVSQRIAVIDKLGSDSTEEKTLIKALEKKVTDVEKAAGALARQRKKTKPAQASSSASGSQALTEQRSRKFSLIFPSYPHRTARCHALLQCRYRPFGQSALRGLKSATQRMTRRNHC